MGPKKADELSSLRPCWAFTVMYLNKAKQEDSLNEFTSS